MPPGRTLGFDRDAALEAAMQLFWMKGYAATSVAELCKAMGIASPSMYGSFGNKEEIFTEAMEHYHRTRGSLIQAEVDAVPSAKGAVEAFLMAMVKTYTRGGQPTGCMATLASVEHLGSTRLSTFVREGRALGFELLRYRLQQGVVSGEIPETADVDLVARGYAGIAQGLCLQARDGVSRDVLVATVKAMMAGFDAMVGKAGREAKT